MQLSEDTITFGKYKDLTLTEMLRDRKYCFWLVKQDWFQKQYEYLYNRVIEHCPKHYFVNLEPFSIEENKGIPPEQFIKLYEYFHLTPLDKLNIELTESEKKCYQFYLDTLETLEFRIIERIGEENPYNIKAPSKWLKTFETKFGLPRSVFKDFLSVYELPNIPYIIEDIKKVGGIDYKGAKSFLIAKERSLKQEQFWEQKLKEKYGEDIGTQFKFKNCIFDMICISNKTLYECKLGLKDFSEEQHKKYLAILGTGYKIIYLVGDDCVIDINKQKIYTGKPLVLLSKKKESKFDELIKNFEIIETENTLDYI